MANSTGQIFGYILSCIGLVGNIFATFMNDWKTYARDNGNVLPQEGHMGLWKNCIGVGGMLTCTSLSSVLFQSQELNISRAMMITSIVLCGFASLVTILGLKCTNCADENKRAKSVCAVTGGVLFLLGGLCALGLITWYAYEVVQEFHSDANGLVKFEFGSALFVGGGAALLSIIGGLLLCLSSRTQSQNSSYAAKTSVSQTRGTDYV